MAEIKTILADVDPTASEHLAIERAHQIAMVSGASVHLLLSVYQESLTDGALMNNESIEQTRQEYMARLGDWLDERSRVLRDNGIDATSEVVWRSPRYESLLSKAAELRADLIIRAAKKHSRIDRLLFGVTDWELVRRAPQPLWVVKTSLDPAKGGVAVLVAVDPAHPGEHKAGLDRKLLTTADAIVKLFGGALHVFHAYNPGAAIAPVAAAGHHAALPMLATGGELMAELRKLRSKQLHKLAEPFGVPADNVHLVEADTETALLEIVEEQDIDIVVAGAVSRGRLERLLIGSTAERILDAVHCDVVVVKPDGLHRFN
ncbi:MAG: universal stress protein [Woeseiaceae bacterium]